jgi:hypothetical protein
VTNPYRIFERLADEELVLPYLEMNLQTENWPDSYTIEVDSTPYTGYGDGYFHPSSHVFAGERQLYYALHPELRMLRVRERRNLSSNMTLAMGSALHAVIQTQLVMADLVVPEDIEIPLVNEQVRGRGNMDWAINHPNGTRYACEFKTQNSRSFAKQTTPKEIWVGQLNMYMDWAGLDHGIVIVCESGWPYMMKEFRVDRDQDLIDRTYAKWARVLDAIDRNEPPGACCGLGSEQMQKCPARNLCWLSDNPELTPDGM